MSLIDKDEHINDLYNAVMALKDDLDDTDINLDNQQIVHEILLRRINNLPLQYTDVFTVSDFYPLISEGYIEEVYTMKSNINSVYYKLKEMLNGYT